MPRSRWQVLMGVPEVAPPRPGMVCVKDFKERLVKGTRVLTVEPEHISTDWDPEALIQRRWNVAGTVIGHHDSHGLVYVVRHDGGFSEACYEPRELWCSGAGLDWCWP